MKLEILNKAIKDLNHEKTLYFLELENVHGQLSVSDISSPEEEFIKTLAQHVEYEYEKIQPVNQIPLLFHIAFY
jgi:hypothetical protein